MAEGGEAVPAAAAVAMSNDQLRQLIQDVGGGRNAGGRRRVPSFESGMPRDWQAWRRTFENVARLYGWGERDQTAHIAAAMEGVACRRVSHIDHSQNNPATGAAWTGRQLLDRYAQVFLPDAASDYARNLFLEAEQEEDEPLTEWFVRLKELFEIAHPHEDSETARETREKFMSGMWSNEIAKETYRQRPATFSDALKDAQTVAAGMMLFNKSRTKKPVKGGGRDLNDPFRVAALEVVNADGTRNRSAQAVAATAASGPKDNTTDWIKNVVCHWCKKKGHLQRDCRKKAAAAKAGRGRGGGGGSGGKGRGGTNSKVNSYQINALTEALKQLATDEEDQDGAASTSEN